MSHTHYTNNINLQIKLPCQVIGTTPGQSSLDLEKGPATISDKFLEKFRGGVSFSIKKFILQILGTLNINQVY